MMYRLLYSSKIVFKRTTITMFIVEVTYTNLRIDIIVFRFSSYVAIRVSLTSYFMKKMD